MFRPERAGRPRAVNRRLGNPQNAGPLVRGPARASATTTALIWCESGRTSLVVTASIGSWMPAILMRCASASNRNSAPSASNAHRDSGDRTVIAARSTGYRSRSPYSPAAYWTITALRRLPGGYRHQANCAIRGGQRRPPRSAFTSTHSAGRNRVRGGLAKLQAVTHSRAGCRLFSRIRRSGPSVGGCRGRAG